MADAQRIEHLHIREAFEEEDALGEMIRVMHLLNGLFFPFFCEFEKAPIVENAVMQPVLIDSRQLCAQSAIEIVDDLRVTAHVRILSMKIDLGRQFVGATAFTIAAPRALIQSSRGVLVDDGDDTAHAAPAFRLATHVPEHCRNRRSVTA